MDVRFLKNIFFQILIEVDFSKKKKYFFGVPLDEGFLKNIFLQILIEVDFKKKISFSISNRRGFLKIFLKYVFSKLQLT